MDMSPSLAPADTQTSVGQSAQLPATASKGDPGGEGGLEKYVQMGIAQGWTVTDQGNGVFNFFCQTDVSLYPNGVDYEAGSTYLMQNDNGTWQATDITMTDLNDPSKLPSFIVPCE